jgi:protein-S-isoprenylcysteine O-methyltransferase Ste14
VWQFYNPGAVKIRFKRYREEMFVTICAYLLIGYFFIGIERHLRQGPEAKSWQRGPYDQGSQVAVGVGLGISSVVLMAAPLLNYFRIGHIRHDLSVGLLGLFVMLGGLGLRYRAAKALGEYYTRTLQIKAEHRVVEQGPYRMIRHPGYLGVILLFIGAGAATGNWVAIIVIPLSLFSAYTYRIYAEEKMLQIALGESYRDYMRRTWRLIPYLY